MALVRDDIVGEVIDKTKEHDRADLIADCLNRTLENHSMAQFEDGTPIPLDCLKTTADISLTAGSYIHTLSDNSITDFIFAYQRRIKMIDTTNNDSWLVHRISKEKFDEIYHDITLSTAVQQKPIHWAIDQETIYTAPPSDGTYTLKFPYTKLHPRIFSNSDTILLPEKFRKSLVFGTMAELYDELNEDQMAQKYENKSFSHLVAMSNVAQRNTKGANATRYNDL